MPRPPRIHFPGALFHVMSRGVGGMQIFHDPMDYQRFMKDLREVKRELPFLLYAYCLMPNHIHLLIEVDRFPLGAVMQRLLTRYSQWFMAKHEHRGHLLQGRYKALVCSKDNYLLQLVRYIHLNPVRAGLASSSAGWPWSGDRDYQNAISDVVDVAFPLSVFSPDAVRARKLYSQFIHDCAGEKINSNAGMGGSGMILGQERENHDSMLFQMAQQTAAQMGVDHRLLFGSTRARPISRARRRFAQAALSMGYGPSEIASYLGITCAAVCQMRRKT